MTPATGLARLLAEAFGDRAQAGAELAPLTTFKVGGRADWLVSVQGADELQRVVTIAASAGAPLTILGGGSNVLIADAGIRGIVVRPRGGTVERTADGFVRADAAVTINGLVRWTVNRGVACIEDWAGTPGTVGGAIHGNAHFQGRNVGDLIDRVRLIDRSGCMHDVSAGEMEFGYDYSRLQRTREIVVWAAFRARDGEVAVLREAARRSLAFRKRTQPLESPSAGCIFQNPDSARDRVPPGIPPSAGALVDRAGLKGVREGRARVSPTHANFIVNEGGATAAEIRALIERCKRDVLREHGVALREEIVYLGFDDGP
ncbi:MAG TPA: UDP-N-acetylmuramate dehydrogenase [Vicinamibacterales bacterium]|jgi:UDP-N-acetylmuramate dehydrogenase|nr:UDP-N-acetylmuramate dehydrogenase [Vicinamibacterales bacterium]